MPAAPAAPAAPLFVPEVVPEGYLHFSEACQPGRRATIAAIGDLLIHHELQRQALVADDGFVNLWHSVVDLLSKADYTYANLEGPVAWGLDYRARKVRDPGKVFDDKVYTGYPRFNYHKSVLGDLSRSGVDIVSMANNHALDRGPLGLDRTLDALDQSPLVHFGARRKGSDAPWHVITEINGLRVAWVGCTLYTNQDDDHDQVIDCYDKPDRVAPVVRELAGRDDVDAVLVAAHAGKEYIARPKKKKVRMIHRLLEAGALAVIGAHPHVLQPWQKYITRDGRETFLIHSLGNFCSHQRPLPRRSSMILYLGLNKGEDGTTRISGARYVPIHVRMEGDNDKFFVEAIDRVGGPADSRKLTVAMFGEYNLLGPDEPLVMNPHCAPDWRHHVK